MRQKASELIKGEWYADVESIDIHPQFFKYYREDEYVQIFSKQKGEDPYKCEEDGSIIFSLGFKWYIPTKEDVIKYNLNKKE